jgi:hypothetical protein
LNIGLGGSVELAFVELRPASRKNVDLCGAGEMDQVESPAGRHGAQGLFRIHGVVGKSRQRRKNSRSSAPGCRRRSSAAYIAFIVSYISTAWSYFCCADRRWLRSG